MNRKPDQQRADQDRGNRKEDQPDDHEGDFRPAARLGEAPKDANTSPSNALSIPIKRQQLSLR